VLGVYHVFRGSPDEAIANAVQVPVNDPLSGVASLRRAREASKPRGDIFIGCDPLQSLPPGRAGEAGQRFFASLAHGRAMALSALGQQR
jgi:hypothetical protein